MYQEVNIQDAYQGMTFDYFTNYSLIQTHNLVSIIQTMTWTVWLFRIVSTNNFENYIVKDK